MNSVSKVYARPDLRVGWMVSKDTELNKAIARSITTVGQITDEPQNAAQLLLLNGKEFVEETKLRLARRAAKLAEMINKIPGLHMDAGEGKPRGAIYGWIDCSGLLGKTLPAEFALNKKEVKLDTLDNVAEFFRQAACVGTVDGKPFCAPGSHLADKNNKYIRMVLTDEKILEEACTRMAAAVARLQPIEVERSSWVATTATSPSTVLPAAHRAASRA